MFTTKTKVILVFAMIIGGLMVYLSFNNFFGGASGVTAVVGGLIVLLSLTIISAPSICKDEDSKRRFEEMESKRVDKERIRRINTAWNNAQKNYDVRYNKDKK